MTSELHVPDTMLTAEEVAQRLEKTVETLKAWRKRGIGPPYYAKLRPIRYSARGLEKWLEDQLTGQRVLKG